MSINYTYEITAVDEAARCMEIIYTAEGRQTMHIGTRLPYEGESLEHVVAAYAPVAYWQEQERVVVSPAVGQTGMIDTTPPAAPVLIAPVSPRQIRMALTRAGLRAQVEAAIASGDQDLKDWYEFSITFERTNAQVAAMGQALGQTEAQLDALWTLAATL